VREHACGGRGGVTVVLSASADGRAGAGLGVPHARVAELPAGAGTGYYMNHTGSRTRAQRARSFLVCMRPHSHWILWKCPVGCTLTLISSGRSESESVRQMEKGSM
jgi:hypothetical protein